jgi:hypothetical protein
MAEGEEQKEERARYSSIPEIRKEKYNWQEGKWSVLSEIRQMWVPTGALAYLCLIAPWSRQVACL